MFFQEAKLRPDEEASNESSKGINFITINGITIVDGCEQAKEIPDDPTIPVGQLLLDIPGGVVDYNSYIDYMTKPIEGYDVTTAQGS